MPLTRSRSDERRSRHSSVHRTFVRTFTLLAPSDHATLMPLNEGIIKLWKKGAWRRLVWELPATVDVAVGTDTIARLLTEVNLHDAPQPAPRRSSHRRGAVRNPTAARTAAAPVIIEPLRRAQSPVLPVAYLHNEIVIHA